MFWGGGLGMAVGSVVLVMAPNAYLSLLGTLLMGLLGGVLLMLVHSTLSDRHGVRRNVAITEANLTASVAACFCPLLIGGLQLWGGGWRATLLVGVGWMLLMVVCWTREPVPTSQAPAVSPEAPAVRLPAAFWSWWMVMFFVVSVEWSMGMWAAVFLETVVGLPKVWAATLMVVYFVAAAVGRVSALHLTRTTPLHVLLGRAFAITGVGLLLFWLPRTLYFAITGLLLCGLGIANFFPLTLALAVNTCPAHSDAASARLMLAVGLAGLTVPFSIGLVADRSSLQIAYTIVGVVLLLATIMAARARRGVVPTAEEERSTNLANDR